jgi:glycosyltransferase involved in cell wall biosynthesis
MPTRKIPLPLATHAPDFDELKVALAHDYLREYGGAERVLEALHRLFPGAPLYTAFTDQMALGIHWRRFSRWKIYRSWLEKIPGYRKWYSPLRVLAPQFFRSFDLNSYDVVVSSANAYMAKAVQVRPGALHLCYCHTPPRSLYGYTTQTNWQANPVTRWLGSLLNHYLRIVDVEVSQTVHHFIANSLETQARIAKFYRRSSTVIYPPVQMVGLPSGTDLKKRAEEGYYLYVNRLAFAKHPELAVQAATELELPLKVVGSGAMLPQLQAIAGPTVEFLGAVEDDKLHQLYQGAKALLYPVEDEDFGIVPVEAMSAGVPVIAHRSGGPRETIINGQTGVFFDELTVEAIKAALLAADGQTWQPKAIAAHAEQFSEAAFAKQVRELVTKLVAAKFQPQS